MHVRVRPGAPPVVLGTYASPAYPDWFEVPRQYTSAAMRLVESGELEIMPATARAAVSDAAAPVVAQPTDSAPAVVADHLGFPARPPAGRRRRGS